jgi:hypothetical protein
VDLTFDKFQVHWGK